MRSRGAMTFPRHSLSALLTLALVVVGCDSGGTSEAKPKAAAKGKAAAAAKAEPGQTDPAAPKADPAPADGGGTPAAVEEDEPDDTALPPSDDGDVPDEPEDVAADEPEAAADDAAADEPEEAADDAAEDEPEEAAADGGAGAVASGSEVNGIALDGEAELLRLVLAHDVVDRQPVDPSTTFPAGQRVNLFVEARNETGEEQLVRVTWETVKNGRRSPPTNVRIASRKLHRTRAYRTIKRPGEYKAIVLGEGDEELAVIPFTVTE